MSELLRRSIDQHGYAKTEDDRAACLQNALNEIYHQLFGRVKRRLDAKADHIPDPAQKAEDHVADTGKKVQFKVGDWVRATGRPKHVTASIVNALGKVTSNFNAYYPYIVKIVGGIEWGFFADELAPWTPEPDEKVKVKLKGGTVLVGTWDNRSNNDIVWLESVGVDSSRAVYVFKSRIISIEPVVEDGKWRRAW